MYKVAGVKSCPARSIIHLHAQSTSSKNAALHVRVHMSCAAIFTAGPRTVPVSYGYLHAHSPHLVPLRGLRRGVVCIDGHRGGTMEASPYIEDSLVVVKGILDLLRRFAL